MTNKPKIVLHIGAHKTGSTYIQKSLFLNRENLAKSGVLYPETGIESYGNPDVCGHHKIVEELLLHNDSDSLKKLLIEGGDYQQVIISSEEFENLDLEHIKLLLDQLQGLPCLIVFYLRRFDDLLFSAWKEEVKHGGAATWYEYLTSHVIRPFGSDIVNPLNVIDRFRLAGAKNIHFISYDETINSGQDLVTEFLKLVGLEDCFAPTGELVNKGMDTADIEIIRIMNLMYIDRVGSNPHTLVRDRYIDALRNNERDFMRLRSAVIEHMHPFTFSGAYFKDALIEYLLSRCVDRPMQLHCEYTRQNKFYNVPSESWFVGKGVWVGVERLFAIIGTDPD